MTHNCLFSACGSDNNCAGSRNNTGCFSFISRDFDVEEGRGRGSWMRRRMPSATTTRVFKIVVFGSSVVGKTSIVEQVVYGVYEPGKTFPTVEDTYDAWIEVEKNQREKIRLYDTAGLNVDSPKVPSHYLHIADGFILIFSVCCERSFKLVEDLKNEIDRARGKDFPILVLGTKIDKPDDRKCDHERIMKWADKEKVKLFEVLTSSRKTLQEPLTWLVKKMSATTGKGSSQADIKKIFRKSATKKQDNGNDT
eukprot:gene12830-14146_t